ncbi:putative AMD2-amidase [Violaceomyces palustris]|uniref:AMD2-amidase n=1 Tax=Violaceomyces palustris TaxID=1673888 RepID=A0ACD0P5R7_9BASI|nr:putative AMD2-amidase [Violaceomyces palustris]
MTLDATPDFRSLALAKSQAKLAAIPDEWKIPDEKMPPDEQKDVTSFPSSSGILTDQELEITQTPAETIVQRLIKGECKSLDVTRAFCKRAAIAHQLTNCLSEIMFQDALKAAKEFDDYFSANGKPFGPLAGLPISIKDNFNVKGYDSTLGFVAWINDPQDEDSTLVTLLKSQGAVIYCKTTTPTAMMIAETVSNANGRTLNPRDRTMTCGGSSGGEGALIAMGGSPLGMGTDIGGSIRIPAAFNAIWGLKPSLGRFPTHKARSGLAGQEAVHSINGPMSQDFSSLELFARTVVGTQPWNVDPKCVPIPWSPVSPSSLPDTGLVFAVIKNNGSVAPTPPVLRALEEACRALREKGHEIIEWEPTGEFQEADNLLEAFFGAEGGEGIYKLMEAGGEHEVWVPGLALGKSGKGFTVGQTWANQARRTGWGGRMLEKMNGIKGQSGRVVDAIISPVAPDVVTPHDSYHYVGYTGAWNLLDAPGVTFPVPDFKVETDKDGKDESYSPMNERDEKVWKEYDVEKLAGLPVCLQLVGRRLQEEKALALAKRVHEILEARGKVAAP